MIRRLLIAISPPLSLTLQIHQLQEHSKARMGFSIWDKRMAPHWDTHPRDTWQDGDSEAWRYNSTARRRLSSNRLLFFIVDQSDPKAAPPFQGTSAAGVAQPSAPLTTSDVAAAHYLGFLTETATPASVSLFPDLISPVSFGQTASSGTILVGGIFPNDDVTQTPNADIFINLGTQDSAIKWTLFLCNCYSARPGTGLHCRPRQQLHGSGRSRHQCRGIFHLYISRSRSDW
jgi:hypothetical protein